MKLAYTIAHTFEYVDLCQVKDARFASVSRKRMIKILNKDTLELEQLIKGLPPEVYKIIAIDSGSLVACSNEEVLIFKYGNNKQYYFDKTIETNKDFNECFFDLASLPNNRFAVSLDRSVNIYKGSDDYSMIAKYEQDRNLKFCFLIVLTDDKRMISIGDSDSVWYCYKNYQLETRLEINLLKQVSTVRCISQFDKKTILLGGEGQIALMNHPHGTIREVINHNRLGMLNTMIPMNESNIIICSNQSGDVFLYDISIRNFCLLVDLKVPIPNMIKGEDRQIALCCDDTTIRVLNINYNYSIDE